MNELEIQSDAFRQALLRSERLRILGILGFILVLVLRGTIRVAIVGDTEMSDLLLRGLVIAAVFTAYESAMLWAVCRGIRLQKPLSIWAWAFNIVIETSLPAVGIVVLVSTETAPEYRALATPSVLAFFILIILSTLRLNPWLCLLTGLVACVSYLIAAMSVGWQPRFAQVSDSVIVQTMVPIYATTLLIGGFVAGGVAHEIRKHVCAALREAETRRQVERLEHDLSIARSIQQSLLPGKPPTIEGYDIAGWNQPADETGGDYFDWQSLSDGRWVVTLADVTGHGIGPALLAAACRAYARAALGPGGDLSESMGRINRALCQDISEGRFVTFVAVVCEPATGRVRLLSAGQGPILVYHHAERRTVELRPQGPPLGIMEDLAGDPPCDIDLQPGDLILLATDGFFEWSDAAGTQFGVARLGEALQAADALPPEQIISRLYEAVTGFSGGTKQQDDLTAVVIKRMA